MLSLVYRPTFEDDLLNIWTEIQHHNPVAADQLIDRLYERCLDLVDYPELGPARPEIGLECRHLVEGSCILLYRINGDCIEMVRAFRKGKDLTPDVFLSDG